MKIKSERGTQLLQGALCGFAVGILFLILQSMTDFMPEMLYARLLDKMQFYEKLAPFFHLSVNAVVNIFHLFSGAVLGMIFTLFFHKLVKNWVSGIAVGCLFGVVWWLITPFYIMPFFFLIPNDVQWHLITSFTLVSAFFGHIIFGGLTGFFYSVLQKISRKG